MKFDFISLRKFYKKYKEKIIKIKKNFKNGYIFIEIKDNIYGFPSSKNTKQIIASNLREIFEKMRIEQILFLISIALKYDFKINKIQENLIALSNDEHILIYDILSEKFLSNKYAIKYYTTIKKNNFKTYKLKKCNRKHFKIIKNFCRNVIDNNNKIKLPSAFTKEIEFKFNLIPIVKKDNSFIFISNRNFKPKKTDNKNVHKLFCEINSVVKRGNYRSLLFTSENIHNLILYSNENITLIKINSVDYTYKIHGEYKNINGNNILIKNKGLLLTQNKLLDLSNSNIIEADNILHELNFYAKGFSKGINTIIKKNGEIVSLYSGIKRILKQDEYKLILDNPKFLYLRDKDLAVYEGRLYALTKKTKIQQLSLKKVFLYLKKNLDLISKMSKCEELLEII